MAAKKQKTAPETRNTPEGADLLKENIALKEEKKSLLEEIDALRKSCNSFKGANTKLVIQRKELSREVERLAQLAEELTAERNALTTKCRATQELLYGLQESVKVFNESPWYKKMKFKFSLVTF